jgi:hypothetical protein
MSMAYQPLAAVVRQLVSVAAEQGGNLRLDGLRQQRWARRCSKPRSVNQQNFLAGKVRKR